MSDKKELKKQEPGKQENINPEELDMEDLKNVSGGAGLRQAPKTKTVDISEDTKNKI